MKTTIVSRFGELGTGIAVPRPHFPMSVYTDASGRAGEVRIWGSLAVIGAARDSALDDLMVELNRRNSDKAEPSGELKGKNLPEEEIAFARSQIPPEGAMFWANCYGNRHDRSLQDRHQRLSDLFRCIRADPCRLDAMHINARFDAAADYYDRLKPVHKHNFVSLVAHHHWLFEQIGRLQIGDSLLSVAFAVDQENFPQPVQECAWFLKLWACAALQSAGVSIKLTGAALGETNVGGAVTVQVDADSRNKPGLQLVDILLQGVARDVRGFGRNSSLGPRGKTR